MNRGSLEIFRQVGHLKSIFQFRRVCNNLLRYGPPSWPNGSSQMYNLQERIFTSAHIDELRGAHEVYEYVIEG